MLENDPPPPPPPRIMCSFFSLCRFCPSLDEEGGTGGGGGGVRTSYKEGRRRLGSSSTMRTRRSTDFSGGRPVIVFLCVFLFCSLLRLTPFLSHNKTQTKEGFVPHASARLLIRLTKHPSSLLGDLLEVFDSKFEAQACACAPCAREIT